MHVSPIDIRPAASDEALIVASILTEAAQWLRDTGRPLWDPSEVSEDAIRNGDQPRATAAIHWYGDQGHAHRPVFDLLLRYACSEDGALHAEKYYRTVAENFAASRAAFRWQHVVALARVTASAYGQPAPGYAEACRLLQV